MTICLLCISLNVASQDAPVTTFGAITDAVIGETVIIPVTIKDFVSIGSFTLSFSYATSNATFLSTTSHPSLSGLTVDQTVSGNFEYIVVTWPQTPGGLTLPDETVLLELNFTYLGGTCRLNWHHSYPYVCQYEKYSAGSYVLLNDIPKSSFYINGGFSNRASPVTTAGMITNAVSGTQYDIPVTVTGFTSIGSMYLQMDFDSDVLTFVSVTKNPSFSGSFTSGVSVVSGSIQRLTIGWFGSGLTLADGSTIYTIRFTYSNLAGQANHSTLSWYDTGSSCEYADAGANVLIDMPQEEYYHDGYVISQEAPTVWLPGLASATASSPIDVPVLTADFSDIHSFNLTFEYDTSALSYNGFTANVAFGGALTVSNTAPAGSKRRIVLHWPGPGPLSLPDSSTLVTLDITPKTAPTDLAWVTDDATSCRFDDDVGNALYDLPKESHYIDGYLYTQPAPLTIAGQVNASTPGTVTIPVLVYRFLNLGIWNLEFDFDPGVLTYQYASLLPAIGGSFSASQQGSGRIALSWTGTTTTLPDSTALVELVFNYIDGSSLLAWHDDGPSCSFAASASDSALYDSPQEEYYINGYVGPDPLQAAFIAGNLAPAIGQVVQLTDISTGTPDGWHWAISPSTFMFVNGTDATSQDPQVQFTTGGSYDITLYITRGTLSNARVRSEYIRAGTPGLWTGNVSTDWYTASNWENLLVPDGSVNVIIPGSPDGNNYPVVPGNLVTNVNCQNITLESPAELTIDGELQVQPGTQVFITGNGNARLKFE